MGIGDEVKVLVPDLSTVKRAGVAAYNRTSAAVTKIDQVVRVDGIQKLHQYLPDGETRAQIGLFATTLAQNTAKYAVYEGFKHIPGAKVASKLVSDTIHEVKQQNQKDGMKATPQQESYSSENGKSNSQNENENEGGGGHWRSKL